jgi:hypothetical protein
MIIEYDMVAKAFFRYQDDNKVLIFASGVANSSDHRPMYSTKSKWRDSSTRIMKDT